MKKLFFLSAVLGLCLAGCAGTEKPMTENTNQNIPAAVTPPAAVVTYKQAVITTSLGEITIEFYGNDSPKTVKNFTDLAAKGFYNGTKFHRVIKGFMIQGGDPNSKTDDKSSWGRGGPGYTFADEFNSHPLVRGSLAMANAGPNTNGSQFFIVTAPATAWLDGKHTNFGQVTAGLDVVDKIENVKTDGNDAPLTDVVIEKIELK
jgi:cyclophilin family peptidyl-prolyl cis-trans isomerase